MSTVRSDIDVTVQFPLTGIQAGGPQQEALFSNLWTLFPVGLHRLSAFLGTAFSTNSFEVSRSNGLHQPPAATANDHVKCLALHSSGGGFVLLGAFGLTSSSLVCMHMKRMVFVNDLRAVASLPLPALSSVTDFTDEL